jgi:hypothetical protein
MSGEFKMRNRFGSVRKLALRTAMAASLAVAAAATPAMAKDAKADGNSPEFIAAAQPLQKTLAAAAPLIKKYQEATDPAAKEAAMTALKTAFAPAVPQFQAVEKTAKTNGDKYLLGQWGTNIGIISGDQTILTHAFQLILDSGKGSPADQAATRYKLGVTAYQNKDYATAISAVSPLVAANYSDDSAAEVLAMSYAGQDKIPQALDALKSAAAARKAAGGTVPNSWLLRGNQLAYKLKNPALGAEWAVLTVTYQPTPENWISSAQLLRIYNGYTGQDALDLERLLLRSGALAGDLKNARPEFIDYIQTADARRQPGEVLSVIDTGTKLGAISATDAPVAEAKNLASSLVAADKASLPRLDKEARVASASPAAIIGTADAFLGYGDAAKAAELYQLALTRPGVDKARALTRLGIAQSDQGNYAGAAETFAQITGPRQPLAQMWLAYVRQKGGLR